MSTQISPKEALDLSSAVVPDLAGAEEYSTALLTLASEQTDPVRLEALQKAGTEVANRGEAGFNSAQSSLEAANTWDDLMRQQATDLNLAEQRIRGERPLIFDEAANSIAIWVSENRASGSEELQIEAVTLDDSLRRTKRGDTAAARDLLRTIETNLSDFANSTESRQSEGYKAEVARLRSLRDSVFIEAQRQERATRKTIAEKQQLAEREVSMTGARADVEAALNVSGEIVTRPNSPEASASNKNEGTLLDAVAGSLQNQGPYNNKKGIEIFLTAANQMGISEKALVQALIPAFKQIADKSREQHPEKPSNAHESFATNQIMASMQRSPNYKALLDRVGGIVNTSGAQLGVIGQQGWDINNMILRDFLQAAV